MISGVNIHAVVERSLLNIDNKGLHKQDIIKKYINALKKCGVDIFEINSDFISSFENLPKAEYMLNVNGEDALDEPLPKEIKYLVFNTKTYHLISKAKRMCKNNVKYVFDIEPKGIGKVTKNIDTISSLFGGRIDVLRVCNIKDLCFKRYEKNIVKLKLLTGLLISISSSNENYCATGIMVQSLLSGCEIICTSFDGIMDQAATEEILLAAEHILGLNISGDSKYLKEASMYYSKLFNKKIDKNKPVIGNNIFKVESGIHVDAILKNPDTYEPFSPDRVGLKREIVLGKHSGKSSIKAKLIELNITLKEKELEKILQEIKIETIKTGKNIGNREFRRIVFN